MPGDWTKDWEVLQASLALHELAFGGEIEEETSVQRHLAFRLLKIAHQFEVIWLCAEKVVYRQTVLVP